MFFLGLFQAEDARFAGFLELCGQVGVVGLKGFAVEALGGLRFPGGERLAALVQEKPEAKDTGVIAGALDKAWGTYARINKLDDAKPEPTNDYSEMADRVRKKLGL